MIRLVIFELVHDKVESWPVDESELGEAVSVHAGVRPPPPPPLVATDAVQVTVPPGPTAVPVKVVLVAVSDGVLTEPEATGVTAPMLLSIVKEVACAVVHESVEVLPGLTLVGFAVSVQVGGGGGVLVIVTVAVQCTVPPAPVAVPV
jgi:hypothetical protein